MKRREFIKAIGTGAASATVLSASVQAGSSISNVVSADMSIQQIPMDATGMAELVRNGKATPKELVQEAQYKINQTNAQVNAVVATCFEEALARADKINIHSPFAGVPFLAKDCVDVAGMPCTGGAKINKGRIAEHTSHYIKAADNAGLNVIGLTNVPEFNALPCTRNALYGPTRNPWDLTRSVLSSTGGGAAAIAAGYTPIVHSTDGGGSSRVPASSAGIFGWKPSREQLITGRVDGITDEGFTHQSIMARTVRDVALAISVTENHVKNLFDTPWPRTPTGFVTTQLTRKLRVGVYLKDIWGKLPDQETQNAISATVKLLTSLGHDVVEIAPPELDGREFNDNYMGVFGAALAGMANNFDSAGLSLEEAVGNNVSYIARMLQTRQRNNSSMETDALAYVNQFSLDHNHLFFNDIDVALSPVTAQEAPQLEYFSLDIDGETLYKRTEAFASYRFVENVAGNPGMSVPLYWTKNNFPIGSHFSARRGNDRLLLELAYQLEAAEPWAQRKAPIFV